MSVPLTGVTLNPVALHAVAVLAAIVGLGLTVIVTEKVPPVHVGVAGVTVYVAVWLVFVGFMSVPVMDAAPEPVAPPVRPPVTTGNPHE